MKTSMLAWTKRTVLAALVFALCIFVLSCSKSEEVLYVEEQIAAIGTITESSLPDIERVEKLYSELEEKDRRKVENLATLETSRKEYNELMAHNVSKLIDEIGTVDKDSKKELDEALGAYEALTDAQKVLVDNYDALQSAYDQYDKVLIEEVEARIRKIQYDGSREPSGALIAAIESAKNEYDKLPDDLKPQVKSYSNLAVIEETISQYYIQDAQRSIDTAIRLGSGYSEAKVLYESLTEEQKKEISNYGEFGIAVADCYSEFRQLVDDKRYTEAIEYFDSRGLYLDYEDAKNYYNYAKGMKIYIETKFVSFNDLQTVIECLTKSTNFKDSDGTVKEIKGDLNRLVGRYMYRQHPQSYIALFLIIKENGDVILNSGTASDKEIDSDILGLSKHRLAYVNLESGSYYALCPNRQEDFDHCKYTITLYPDYITLKQAWGDTGNGVFAANYIKY